MVKSWSPDVIITTGDNSYGVGPIDVNIGQYYHEFIGNYVGAYGAGSAVNRYFPSLGNHDFSDGGGLDAYLNYFTLPGDGISSTGSSGNERYYDFQIGPVHFFAINSDDSEPDGNYWNSPQADWLHVQLSRSSAPWRIVYMHHAPFSSCTVHGSQEVMQWPYEAWGADVVLAGHDHTYERIMRDDNLDHDSIPYFVTGVGGFTIYGFLSDWSVPGSAVRYKDNFGAMLVEADDSVLTLKFCSITGGGTLIDSLTIRKKPSCCEDVRGNVNGRDIVDLSDLSGLICYLAGRGFYLPCFQEADLNGSGIVDPSDLAMLVLYLTGGNQPLPTCARQPLR